MKTKDQVIKEIGKLMWELEIFNAQENDFMMEKIERKISELNKFLNELDKGSAMDGATLKA